MAALFIEVGKVSISIYSSSAEILNSVSQTAFSGIVSFSEKTGDIQYEISISDGKYYLSRNAKLTHRNRKIENILFSLEWQIVDDLLRGNFDLLQFHGAALERDNRAWILLGIGGSGKTSSCISLMKSGWRLLSDEVVLINPKTLHAIPFPRNLIIKPHLTDYVDIPHNLQKLKIDTESNGKQTAYFLSPLTLGKISQKVSIPIKKIFFIQQSETTDFKIEKVGQFDAFNQLISLLFNSSSFKFKTTNILLSLINSIPIHKLRIRNPLQLVDGLEYNLLKTDENLRYS